MVERIATIIEKIFPCDIFPLMCVFASMFVSSLHDAMSMDFYHNSGIIRIEISISNFTHTSLLLTLYGKNDIVV